MISPCLDKKHKLSFMHIYETDIEKKMQLTLEQELDTIERDSADWSSSPHYNRISLQKFEEVLQSCLAVTSDNTFLNMVIHRRPDAFDRFEYIAADLFKQWYYKKGSLIVEQIHYLTTVGTFNRRLALTLQSDNNDSDEESEQQKSNLEHHQRARKLLFDVDNQLFDILMKILPYISEHEPQLIEMVLPWYESYIFFEHNYIDSTLDEKFHYFNRQIIQCLKSSEYKQSLLIIENNQAIMLTVRHRFYLGICTMAMGIHVNCDENECDDAKSLLELYLPHYITFIHHLLTHKQNRSLDNLVCLTGIITYLINYTLVLNNNDNLQLLIDLFSIILNENFYMNISANWSKYETILIDSIVGYLMIYCLNNCLIVKQLLRTHDNCVEYLENLIDQAHKCGNRRIAIMSQLFLLILMSCTKNKDLPERLVLSCLNYIQISLQNVRTHHYNRIPMSVFFKSLINIVKYDHIQNMIHKQYLDLFTSVVINYERKRLYDDYIYRECTMMTLNILWSLSFNENMKKFLKQNEKNLFNIIQKINTDTNDMSVRQATCGLLYNLDWLDLTKVSSMI